jgi:hypothetical protein
LSRYETTLIHRLWRSLAGLDRLQAPRAASIPAQVVVPSSASWLGSYRKLIVAGRGDPAASRGSRSLPTDPGGISG